MIKYIFVTGGVVSGLGKGITAASIGMMLKAKGLKVIAQKLDPYINIDPATISPFQHGEVFVTEDGNEADLDLGHYERFIDVNLNKYSNLTTGKVYWNVLNNERSGVYSGETVQVIPHITGEIKKFIYTVGKKIDADVVITEIGGTAGDIEGLPFIEAIRQVSNEVGRDNCLFVHVTLAPYLTSTGELKSKPTQHSVNILQGLGITPNIIVIRSDKPLNNSFKNKISLYCNVPADCVIENLNVPLLYEVPLMLEKSNISSIISRELGLNDNPPDFTEWNAMLDKARSRQGKVTIGIVGEYVKMFDAYLSVTEALTHAGIDCGTNVEIKWIDSDEITESNVSERLEGCDGVVLPGGFGDRGVEGMVSVAHHCRTTDLPYFGVCLGLQMLVIDYARSKAGITDANSRESDPTTPNKVIDLAGSGGAGQTSGIRVGAYRCVAFPDTLLAKAYGAKKGKSIEVDERHRHRYEFNNDYRQVLTEAGLSFSGLSPDGTLVEAVEVKGNKFCMGVQFHPEFKSRPHRPHPLYIEFIKAAMQK